MGIFSDPLGGSQSFAVYGGRLRVVRAVVCERRAGEGFLPRLIFAVVSVYVGDELSVQEVERDVLGAYARAFSAVCAASGNVERADYVEHILLERIGCRLLRYPGCGIVEYAVFAGAGGTT